MIKASAVILFISSGLCLLMSVMCLTMVAPPTAVSDGDVHELLALGGLSGLASVAVAYCATQAWRNS